MDEDLIRALQNIQDHKKLSDPAQIAALANLLGISHNGDSSSLTYSQQDEEYWYSDKVMGSFARFKKYFYEHPGLDISNGYLRNTIRRFADEVEVLFSEWMDDFFDEDEYDDEVSEQTLETFFSVIYFFAERHAEQHFYDIVEYLDSFSEEYSFYDFFDDGCEHIRHILYATYNGDLEFFLETMMDDETHPDLSQEMAFTLAQLCIDGCYPDKSERLLRDYVQFIIDHQMEGHVAIKWIIMTNHQDSMRRQLQHLVKHNIEFLEFGTKDIGKIVSIIHDAYRKIGPFCKKGLLMEDAILYGLYPDKIRTSRKRRQRVTQEQEERLSRWR